MARNPIDADVDPCKVSKDAAAISSTSTSSESGSMVSSVTSSMIQSNRNTNSTNHIHVVEPSPSTASHWPLIEIREELDTLGNEINAEATNVTQQLQYLQKQLQQQHMEEQQQREGSMVDDLPIRTTCHNAEVSKVSQSTEMDFGMSIESPNVKDELQKRGLTEEAYRTLSERLDQLILLEEQAESHTRNATTPSKAFQSKMASGWKKGFLNQPKKSTVVNQLQVDHTNSASTVVTATAAAAKASGNPAVNDTNTMKVQVPLSETSRTKVSFHESPSHDTIHEIPRIGERSIRDHLSKSVTGMAGHPHSSSTTTNTTIPIPTNRHRASFDASIFAPHVMEKLKTSKQHGTPSCSIASSSLDQDHVHRDEEEDVVPNMPTQKVSRFARERRMQQNGA
jgi:myosin heavy subunit